MAEATRVIRKHLPTEQELQQQSLSELIEDLSKNREALQETVKLLQVLHESGILEAISSLLQAKDKVAKIAVGQLLRPNVTTTINNLMSAAELLGQLDPELTKKLVQGVASGLERAGVNAKTGKKVGVFDLVKLMRDPDISRVMSFGLNFLKGLGENLKDTTRI